MVKTCLQIWKEWNPPLSAYVSLKRKAGQTKEVCKRIKTKEEEEWNPPQSAYDSQKRKAAKSTEVSKRIKSTEEEETKQAS